MKTLVLFLLTIIFSLQAVQAQFVQAPLPYPYAALEPHLDAKTMEIHYSRHHAAYVKNLNTALEAEGKSSQKDMIAILNNISTYSPTVRNNGGGHFNHDLFWSVLTPNQNTQPSKELSAAISSGFGSMDEFKATFNKKALSVFGSGWAWLIVTPDGKLKITATPNQDNPLMDVVADKGIPILGIDVWEHAYYLNYQNKRADYLTAIWNVINWDEVNRRYTLALNK
jgi:superoxide dismutase, Fe-Mn family